MVYTMNKRKFYPPVTDFQPEKSMVLNLFPCEGQTQALPGPGSFMPGLFSG